MSSTRSKKRARDAAYEFDMKTKAAVVRRDAVHTLDVRTLGRVAKQLRVKRKRTSERTAADIRRDVVAEMVERDCESIRL